MAEDWKVRLRTVSILGFGVGTVETSGKSNSGLAREYSGVFTVFKLKRFKICIAFFKFLKKTTNYRYLIDYMAHRRKRKP